MTRHFIPKHGGYKNLLSYQKAEIIYDATVYFCNRFYEKRDRTFDQMIQAARSGKQNIIEGSMASATSKEMEVKLTNVARSSLEELLGDYRDFLRNNGLEEWSKDHPYAKRLRALVRTKNANYETFRKGIQHSDPEISANVIIGLIRVASVLLKRQIDSLESSFIEHGGLREGMTRARLEERDRQRGIKLPEKKRNKNDNKDNKDSRDSRDKKIRDARGSQDAEDFRNEPGAEGSEDDS
jgi:four helix bundle suffix protein